MPRRTSVFPKAPRSSVTAAVAARCTPRQRRLLGDLGYNFRPGSYTYVPEDQLEVIFGQAS